MIAELWARPRPFIDHSDAVKPLFSQASDASFPSDHATASSALAAAVTVVTPRGGVALWIIALSIASARVVAGVHYVSDVLVGLGVGLVFGGGVAHTAIRLGVIRRHAADVSRS